jgi:hypothetical protein
MRARSHARWHVREATELPEVRAVRRERARLRLEQTEQHLLLILQEPRIEVRTEMLGRVWCAVRCRSRSRLSGWSRSVRAFGLERHASIRCITLCGARSSSPASRHAPTRESGGRELLLDRVASAATL